MEERTTVGSEPFHSYSHAEPGSRGLEDGDKVNVDMRPESVGP